LEAAVVFTETELAGAYIIDIEKRTDGRGFFARSFCAREFEQHGLNARCVNTNVSVSTKRGTLRGMHYQVAPHAEAKLVRCTRGAIDDVIIDLRPGSRTLGKWIGVELTSDNYRMLYVPEGFAHGFMTLTDNVEVTYQVSAFYTPEAEAGIRFDDPAFNIVWPADVRVISDKDRSWPLYPGTTPPAVGRTVAAGAR
jgi:dTDP-4-dehydrorhamnose 3,5-epimerase